MELPALLDASTRELLTNNKDFADAFFFSETRKLREFYARTGNPRLSVLVSKGIAELGVSLGVTSSIGLGVLLLNLAEISLAIGGAPAATASDRWLNDAYLQLSTSSRLTRAPRAMTQLYWLKAICAKVLGRDGEYGQWLTRGHTEKWISENASPADIIPLVRQRVMMQQDLDRYVLLLHESQRYRESNPMEYFRTVKRVVEYFTNAGMREAATSLEAEFLRAFEVVRPKTTLVSKISFLKNVAHLAAARGESARALGILAEAERLARDAGLEGQLRQLRRLREVAQSRDVRHALETLRV